LTARRIACAQSQKVLRVCPDRRDDSKKRIEVHQTAALITADGHAVEVTLKDVSLDGFRIEHAGEDFEPGEIVSLRSGRWAGVRAQIKWATDREAGGIFLDHPDLVPE
jgi:PilZ domain-containing protein